MIFKFYTRFDVHFDWNHNVSSILKHLTGFPHISVFVKECVFQHEQHEPSITMLDLGYDGVFRVICRVSFPLHKTFCITVSFIYSRAYFPPYFF